MPFSTKYQEVNPIIKATGARNEEALVNQRKNRLAFPHDGIFSPSFFSYALLGYININVGSSLPSAVFTNSFLDVNTVCPYYSVGKP